MGSDMGGGGSQQPVARMRIGVDSSELPNDDEIFVVSNNGGDKEVNPNENSW